MLCSPVEKHCFHKERRSKQEEHHPLTSITASKPGANVWENSCDLHIFFVLMCYAHDTKKREFAGTCLSTTEVLGKPVE